MCNQNKALNSSFLNQLIVWSVQMRNILTDFASINWLTVSTYIYSYHHILKQLRIFIDPNKYTSAKKIFEDYLHTSSHITKIQIVTYRSYLSSYFHTTNIMATNITHSETQEKYILKEITKFLTSSNRLWFLSECLRLNLTPSTLKVQPPHKDGGLSNQNTQNTYKNAAKSASRKNVQIAFQDAKKHNRKQTNYFETQAEHQWKNFAQFIKNNKIKIANKIKARYMKKLLSF